MTKRIVLLVLCSCLAAGSLGAMRLFAADSPRALEIYAPSSDAQPAPTELPGPNDCCAEAVQTNYPLPPTSARGNHCPTADVPDGSSNLFDPESGRLEIDFYDVGYEESRTFVLDLRDTACFDTAATRRAIFGELVTYMSYDGDGVSGACKQLREAVRAGSLKLGERPFDLRPAQPYIAEVCPY